MKNVIIFSLIFFVIIAGYMRKDSNVKNESDVETIVINLNKESYDE
ncbi:MAG: hypothetical protein KAX28_04890 [Candidatus Marinimicrobia bacterium]|nr:hypothetical protein [Candidatus Neomarinimicrobiota bacterium]